MSGRYKEQSSKLFPTVELRLFSAIKNKFKEGYSFSDFKCDMMSGVVVGMVAIPLGMALAIASGVAPQYGLYTVIIGGGVVALLGGSRFQVTGPTAAFVVILAPIAQKFGFSGLLVAGLFAGLMLICMGLARMGRLIQFIPYPVTTGFTSGIAVVIATLQLKDFFGLQVEKMPERYFEKIISLFHARSSVSWIEFCIGLFTLMFLIFWPRVNKKIPAPIVALGFVSVVTAMIKSRFPAIEIATIGNRFTFDLGGVIGHGIPQTLPHFEFPWNFIGHDGKTMSVSLETIESLVPSAFAIAMLGAIESLLSAVVADGMAHTKHDPDGELLALGIGNVLCPFFGGIPATGAIARTATNIRFGAKSPFSSVIHAVFTILVILLFAPYVAYLPMAALAALLILVAYNMSERKHFTHILKVAPKSDVIVLLICFSFTVLFDMVVGVSIGVVLAALLFMQRMAKVTGTQKLISHDHLGIQGKIPHDIVVYEIAGPLFFGAAEKAAETMLDITDNIRSVIFVMNGVPAMDITGLVAFESAIKKLANDGKRKVCLVGLKSQPEQLMNKLDLVRNKGNVAIFQSLDDALKFSESVKEAKSVDSSFSLHK